MAVWLAELWAEWRVSQTAEMSEASTAGTKAAKMVAWKAVLTAAMWAHRLVEMKEPWWAECLAGQWAA